MPKPNAYQAFYTAQTGQAFTPKPGSSAALLASMGPSLASQYLAAMNAPKPVAAPVAPSAPGYFQNADGSPNWQRVAMVGGGAILGLVLLVRLTRGGSS